MKSPAVITLICIFSPNMYICRVLLTEAAEAVCRKTAMAAKILSITIVDKLASWLIVSQTFIKEAPSPPK